jgi:hypothetical protein
MDLVIGLAEEHESAAPNVAGLRMHDREREADGDSGVDGIASGFHDVLASLRGKLMDADHHGVLRANRLRLGGMRDQREDAAKQQ